jgi:4-amino-4-deoxy-L-arabinose transferase-like glycosyltransferase
MAASLRVAGPSVYLPRSFSFIFGLGAVVATFALGALLANPDRRAVAATIAGLMAAGSFTSAVVSSRVAWSNSTTPFWTTVAALALVLAVRRPESVARWLAAGLAAGLALNTHPSVAAVLAGLAAWLVLEPARRGLLRTPGPWLALTACIAAYLPVIVYNLAGPADTLAQAAESRNVETELGPGSYAANVLGLVGQLGRSLAGGFDAAEQPIWGAWPLVIALLALSLTIAAARVHVPDIPGRRLPLVLCIAAVLMLPAVNQNWSGFLEARYLALLAPLIGAAAGVLVTAGGTRMARLAAVGAALLIVMSTARSWLHVDAALALANPNGAMLELIRVAGARGDQSGDAAPILVAEELEGIAWPHRGDPARAITYYLMLAGIPFEMERLDTIRHLVAAGTAGAVIAPGPAAETMGLEPIALVREDGYEQWGLYSAAHVGASTTPSPASAPPSEKSAWRRARVWRMAPGRQRCTGTRRRGGVA